MYKPCHQAKLVLAGQSGVGKSSFLVRFIKGESVDTSPTIGAALMRKRLERDSKYIDMDIWDTAGQERYRSLSSYYFRGCHCCLLVFDLNDLSSFESISTWKQQCDTAAGNSTPVYFLIGNKSDVGHRVVSPSIVKKYCQSHGIYNYFETSAKTGDGIQEFHDALVDHLFSRIETLNVEFGILIDPPKTSICPCST